MPSSTRVPLLTVGIVDVYAKSRSLRRARCLANRVSTATASFAWASLLVASAPSSILSCVNWLLFQLGQSHPCVSTRGTSRRRSFRASPMSALGLVDVMLNVLVPGLLMPSLMRPSRTSQHPLVSALVCHLIDVGHSYVSSICTPPAGSLIVVSRMPSPNGSRLPWLSHCVDVSLLPLRNYRRGGCHAGGWHVVHEAVAPENYLFLSQRGLLIRLSLLPFLSCCGVCPLWFWLHYSSMYSGYACVHSNMMTSWWAS